MPNKKKKTTTRRSNRLTRSDMQALTLLDRLVEEDRRIEQKYNLPFRSPRQVASNLRQCTTCGKDIALLIFGDLAKDEASLEAYGRLMEDPIKQKDLPTWIIAPPTDPGNLDSPALLLKVYPDREGAGYTTPDEWEGLIKKLSVEHCRREEKY